MFSGWVGLRVLEGAGPSPEVFDQLFQVCYSLILVSPIPFIAHANFHKCPSLFLRITQEESWHNVGDTGEDPLCFYARNTSYKQSFSVGVIFHLEMFANAATVQPVPFLFLIGWGILPQHAQEAPSFFFATFLRRLDIWSTNSDPMIRET